MKNLMRLILLLLPIFLGLSGCEDKPEEKPAGTIKVQTLPAGAAKSMTLIAISVPVTYFADDSGTFMANNLTGTSYWVTLEPNEGYSQVKLGRFKVDPGKTTDLGTITLPKVVFVDPYIGTFSTTLNNSEWRSYEHGSILNDTSLIIWSKGNRKDLINSQESIVLYLKNISGPGTYLAPSFGGTNGYNYYYHPDLIWSSAKAGGSFQVNITKFDTLAKRVSGNFAFHALPIQSGYTNVRTATNGTFTDLKIQ